MNQRGEKNEDHVDHGSSRQAFRICCCLARAAALSGHISAHMEVTFDLFCRPSVCI